MGSVCVQVLNDPALRMELPLDGALKCEHKSKNVVGYMFNNTWRRQGEEISAARLALIFLIL